MAVHHGSAAHTARRLARLARQVQQAAAQLEREAALPGDLLGTYVCEPHCTPDDLATWLEAVTVERDISQALVVTIVARSVTGEEVAAPCHQGTST